jgi:hypothetical protein
LRSLRAYCFEQGEVRMIATDFEYGHRFWMIVLVYVAAYAFYNVNHVNVLYSIVPWNRGVLQTDKLVRFLYAGAALLAAGGALLLTWSIAYRPPIANRSTRLSPSPDRSAMSGTRSTCPIFY